MQFQTFYMIVMLCLSSGIAIFCAVMIAIMSYDIKNGDENINENKAQIISWYQSTLISILTFWIPSPITGKNSAAGINDVERDNYAMRNNDIELDNDVQQHYPAQRNNDVLRNNDIELDNDVLRNNDANNSPDYEITPKTQLYRIMKIEKYLNEYVENLELDENQATPEISDDEETMTPVNNDQVSVVISE